MPTWVLLFVLAGIVLSGMVLALPLFALWSYHRRQMEQLAFTRNHAISEETRRAIEEIREEVKALRDMTTEYDMSFDTALQRLERRVEHLERRQRATESEPATIYSEQR